MQAAFTRAQAAVDAATTTLTTRNSSTFADVVNEALRRVRTAETCVMDEREKMSVLSRQISEAKAMLDPATRKLATAKRIALSAKINRIPAVSDSLDDGESQLQAALTILEAVLESSTAAVDMAPLKRAVRAAVESIERAHAVASQERVRAEKRERKKQEGRDRLEPVQRRLVAIQQEAERDDLLSAPGALGKSVSEALAYADEAVSSAFRALEAVGPERKAIGHGGRRIDDDGIGEMRAAIDDALEKVDAASRAVSAGHRAKQRAQRELKSAQERLNPGIAKLVELQAAIEVEGLGGSDEVTAKLQEALSSVDAAQRLLRGEASAMATFLNETGTLEYNTVVQQALSDINEAENAISRHRQQCNRERRERKRIASQLADAEQRLLVLTSSIPESHGMGGGASQDAEAFGNVVAVRSALGEAEESVAMANELLAKAEELGRHGSVDGGTGTEGNMLSGELRSAATAARSAVDNAEALVQREMHRAEEAARLRHQQEERARLKAEREAKEARERQAEMDKEMVLLQEELGTIASQLSAVQAATDVDDIRGEPDLNRALLTAERAIENAAARVMSARTVKEARAAIAQAAGRVNAVKPLLITARHRKARREADALRRERGEQRLLVAMRDLDYVAALASEVHVETAATVSMDGARARARARS